MNQPQKHSPAKALNKAFRKVKPDRNSIEFKSPFEREIENLYGLSRDEINVVEEV